MAWKIKQVLLVGAGQLGSRYLQGLAALEDPCSITVVDPSIDSLRLSRERLAQVGIKSNHTFKFKQHIGGLPHQLDLVLVVTPAHCRARVVQDIAEAYKVKSWILEKVLAQSCEQLEQIEQALSLNSQVWINTPMRVMSWHKKIRRHLTDASPCPFNIKVIGGSWGLACNSIHYIDLVSWWLNAHVETISSCGLGDWAESKRPGFKEVNGTLLVSYSDKSTLELNCSYKDSPLRIIVKNTHGEWLIDESAGCATGPRGEQIFGTLDFQSEMTPKIVDLILKHGRCDLPTLTESSAQHRQFLTALLDHWNHVHDCQDSFLPIT